MSLRITTLGTLRVEQDGRVLDRLPAARLRCALLVHLAVEREATRDAVMGLFWANRPPDRARHLLSQTLYELRQELGDDWMEASGEQLRVTDAVEVDAVEMARAVEAGDHDRALEIYQGPFLGGGSLSVTRSMEGWIDAEQSKLTRLHRKARRAAIDGRVEGRCVQEALALARRWVELDPLDDEAQHRLIELLAATGDRSAALRQYDTYARLVETELELEPLEDTQALVERIRQGELGPRNGGSIPVDGEADALATAGSPRGEGGKPYGGVSAPAAYEDIFTADRTEAGSRHTRHDPGRVPADASLLDRIAGARHRPTVQWTLTYLAASIVLLEGLDILTDALGWPAGVLRGAALLLGLGAIVVLGASWYRLEQGRQFGKAEAALTLLVAIFLLSMPVWFSRARPAEAAEDTPPPPINRLAVLYFDDLSPDGSLGRLAAGFTQALIDELNRVDGLAVLPRRSVEPFRADPSVSYDSIVRTLHTGLLVQGSLLPVRDRIRLTLQLIEGATASPVMSDTLETPADSVDQLLAAMPERAARLLRRRLGDWVRLQERKAFATSAEALELVQRAEPLIEDARDVRDRDLGAMLPLLDRADSMLVEAERLAPRWPEPLMMRARVEEIRARATAPIPSQYEPEATATALSHLDRALQRWEDFPPALAQRGNLLFELAEAGHGDEDELLDLYDRAEADLRKAVLLDPNLTEGWWALSRLLLSMESYAEARRTANHAVETDAFLTRNRGSLWHLFRVNFNAQDHQASRYWCDQLREHYGDDAESRQTVAYCQLYLLTTSPIVHPDVDRAWSLRDTIIAAAPEAGRDVYTGFTALQVAKVLVRAGLPDSARAVVRRAAPQPLPTWAPYDVAHVHLLLGEEEAALDVLEQYVEWNPVRAQRLARDWWFERLHGNERFEKLLEEGAG
jgi:DNA-binding SARP family transcriptional activator/TolB-like protein